MSESAPLLYGELAPWFPLLSPPEEYAHEAAAFREIFRRDGTGAMRTLLELGAGAGSNACHLKRDFACTLTDLSEDMLDVSRRLNPECRHIAGDMRTLRLNETFDAVLVHDAVMYMTTEDDLRRAIETASIHCRAGGVAVFAPDYVRETLRGATDCGGSDGAGRAIRYLEWQTDPDPMDTTFQVDFVYVLREDGRADRVVADRHIVGVYPLATWMALLRSAGFDVATAERPRDDGVPDTLFVARKR